MSKTLNFRDENLFKHVTFFLPVCGVLTPGKWFTIILLILPLAILLILSLWI